jgi:C2H2 type zinc finger protein
MSEREEQSGDKEIGTCHICGRTFSTQEELSKHLISFGILEHVRSFVRIVTPLSAGLLLLSGAYVIYYWLTAGRLLI